MPFSDKWQKKEKPGILGRLRNLGGEKKLRESLSNALKEMKIIDNQLNFALTKIKNRDQSIFRQVIFSLEKNDSKRASVYANELIELRKIEKFIAQAQLAFEQISLRLETIITLGDITSESIAPALTVIKQMQGKLQETVPEARESIEDLFSSLSNLMIEAGSSNFNTIEVELANEEAEKILDDAEKIAEKRLKEILPEIPTAISEREEGEIAT